MIKMPALLLIATLGGLAVALQAQFMGLMDRHLGTLESVFITYAGGGLVITVVMALARGGNLANWRMPPSYALTAGLLGLVIVSSIGYATARLGTVAALTVVLAAQFIVSALIDHFGLFGAAVRPLSLIRLAGIGALLVGVWLVTRTGTNP